MSQPQHAGPRRRRPMRGIATFSALAVVAVLSLPMAASAYAAEGDVVDPTTVPAVDVIQDVPAAPADEAPSDVAPDTTPIPDPAPAPEPAPEQVDEPEAPAPEQVPAPAALPQSEPILAMAAPAPQALRVGGNANNTNETTYWENQYSAHQAVCYKYNDSHQANSHGRIVKDSANKWSGVVLNPFDQSWPGDHWEVLVVNGGPNGDAVYEHPTAGTTYYTPGLNGQGKRYDVSHWIVCKGTTPEPPPVTVVAPQFTSPTCEAPGSLVAEETEAYTVAITGSDSSKTVTFTAKPGHKLTGQTVFGPYDLRQLTGEQCQPDYFLESSHVEECGTVTISLRNVSPWIYPMSVEIDGVHSYGPVVDNRGDAPDDQTMTRTITFPEDSGNHTVRYRVQAGTESDLYAGLPVGEWVELVIETNCAPDVVQCEEVIDGGTVTNLDMDGWVVTNGTWTEDGLRLDSDGWVDATVTKPTSFNLSAARDIALDMDVSAAGNYGMGIVFSTSEGDLHWEDLYTDEFWSNEPVLPPTGGGQGGPYSGSLEDALVTVGDLEVTSVTIVFSSATPNSAMLNSATLNCTFLAFEYERPPAPPTKDPTFTEWVDGEWDCGDTTVVQTRTRTDYDAPVWDPETMSWIEDKVGTMTTETQPRTLTDEERKEWQTADPEGECYNRPEPPDPDKGSRTVITCQSVIDYTWDITPVWNEQAGKYDMVKGTETASSPRKPTADELKTAGLTCTTPPNTPPAADTDWSNHESLTSPTWMSTWLAVGIALMVFAGLGASSLVLRLRRRGIQ